MICETCKGAGQVAKRTEEPRGLIVEPCPECGGCGIAHCCEGERPDNLAPE